MVVVFTRFVWLCFGFGGSGFGLNVIWCCGWVCLLVVCVVDFSVNWFAMMVLDGLFRLFMWVGDLLMVFVVLVVLLLVWLFDLFCCW